MVRRSFLHLILRVIRPILKTPLMQNGIWMNYLALQIEDIMIQNALISSQIIFQRMSN